jgi:hypothetical protein
MFYVIMYVTLRYHQGQEIDDLPLQDWEKLGEVALKAAKKGFFGDALPPKTAYYCNFYVWTQKVRVVLLNGCSASAIHSEQVETPENALIFDVETLGSHVSFRMFGDIFYLVVK